MSAVDRPNKNFENETTTHTPYKEKQKSAKQVKIKSSNPAFEKWFGKRSYEDQAHAAFYSEHL